jgi:predicted metal-dependent hydrolase
METLDGISDRDDGSPLAPARARTILPRAERFDWPAGLPRHWFGGDPFRTHYMNALSLLFPEGEQFFIDAVRALRAENHDPHLEAAIRGFIGQEGWHRAAHLAYNAYLENLGMPTKSLEARITNRIAFVKEHLKPIRWLAATVCLEHFTAIMAHHLLRRADDLQSMPEHFRRLWMWHALEELEHKSVAFDLYVCARGSYWMRVRIMLLVTVNFSLDILRNLRGLLRADGLLYDLGVWRSGVRFLWGPRQGLVWSLLPDYLRFFRPGFHPWDADDQDLIRATARALQVAANPA